MINVTHFYGVHVENTKDYHLYLFESDTTGRSILVKSWGKRGTNGQCKVEVSASGSSALNKALNERQGKGYDMQRMSMSNGGKFSNVPDALGILPPVHQRSITNAQLSILDNVNFKQSDKSAFDPLAAQRTDMRRAAEDEANQQSRESEKAETQEFLKSNPIFGMF
jgi:predicted DNA-binding WGR domain protein